MRLIVLVASISLTACSAAPGSADGAPDAAADGESGVDAAITDAALDARTDSGLDAGDAVSDANDSGIVDAGPDAAEAGPICACSTGPCCDGCNFRATTYACATSRTAGSCGGASTFCSPKARTLTYGELVTHCTGNTTACNGNQTDTTIFTDCYEPTPGNFEQFGVCLPPDVGAGLPARCAVNCGL